MQNRWTQTKEKQNTLEIQKLKREIKLLISKNIADAFLKLESQIDLDSNKYNELILLKSRFSNLTSQTNKRIVSYDIQTLESNKLTNDLLLFVDNIKEADLKLKHLVYLRKFENDLTQFYKNTIECLSVEVLNFEGENIAELVERNKIQFSPSVLPSDLFDFDTNESKSTPLEYGSIQELIGHYDKRVWLLGKAGSGKTYALLDIAKNAIETKINDNSELLPIFLRVSTWAEIGYPDNIIEWVLKIHKNFKPETLKKLLDNNSLLFLLDGFDEIKDSEGASEKIRVKFLKMLPNSNSIILTSREEEYFQLKNNIILNGVIRLLPITLIKKKKYLKNFPKLFGLISRNNVLDELTNIPLFLNLFVVTFGRNIENFEELSLIDKGHLRDRIISKFINIRYNNEKKKKKNLRYSIDDIYKYLGLVAMKDAGGGKNSNLFNKRILNEIPNDERNKFWEEMSKLNFIVKISDSQFSFAHMIFRDHFAFKYAVEAVNSPVDNVRDRATWALWQIPDERAVDILIQMLDDPYVYAKGGAIGALGKIKNPKAVPFLISKLDDDEKTTSIYGNKISEIAAWALREINDKFGLQAIAVWEENQKNKKSVSNKG